MSEDTHKQNLSLELNKKLIDVENLFYRSLILINGGLCISSLAFAASISKNHPNPTQLLSELGDAIMIGAWGVALATCSISVGRGSVLSLLRLFLYPSHKIGEQRYKIVMNITFYTSFASLMCFMIACYFIKDALGS